MIRPPPIDFLLLGGTPPHPPPHPPTHPTTHSNTHPLTHASFHSPSAAYEPEHAHGTSCVYNTYTIHRGPHQPPHNADRLDVYTIGTR